MKKRLNMDIRKKIVMTSFIICLLSAINVKALAPLYISDKELSEYPIIVEAKWEKSPFITHNKYRKEQGLGKVVIRRETFTKLNIIRVIKGHLKPGKYKLFVGGGIDWHKDGKDVNSASSTKITGDVSDITKPNIWFLKSRQSWDEKDKTKYISIVNYREIQPLSLENFFTTVSSKNKDKKITELLKSNNFEVLYRTLRYICGGCFPWPYKPWIFYRPNKKGKVITTAASAVKKLIEKDKFQNLLPIALLVYEELKGKQSLKYIRTQLNNKNPDVRAIAITILARYKDEETIKRINQAVYGIKNGWIACKVIESLAKWGDRGIVPALISFLENGESAGFVGDDLFIPAIQSRKALLKITNNPFPFSVKLSIVAWNKVKKIEDPKKCQETLNQILPCLFFPLKAELIGTNHDAYIKLTNISKENITITKYPSHGTQNSEYGGGGFGVENSSAITSKNDFITIQPGELIKLKVKLADYFLRGTKNKRTMSIAFENNGEKFNKSAWIGSIQVKQGKDWKEKQ